MSSICTRSYCAGCKHQLPYDIVTGLLCGFTYHGSTCWRAADMSYGTRAPCNSPQPYILLQSLEGCTTSTFLCEGAEARVADADSLYVKPLYLCLLCHAELFVT